MTLRVGEGFAQSVRVPSYGGGENWPNRNITRKGPVSIIVAEEA